MIQVRIIIASIVVVVLLQVNDLSYYGLLSFKVLLQIV